MSDYFARQLDKLVADPAVRATEIWPGFVDLYPVAAWRRVAARAAKRRRKRERLRP